MPALSKQAPWEDFDTPDPNLTLMRDGKVVMTSFAQGKVCYSSAPAGAYLSAPS